MKFIKNIKKGILLLVASSAIISCGDDFLEVNDNPNAPSFSTASLTLPVAQQSILSLNATSMNYLGNFMTYAWSTPSNWSANQNLFRYNVTSTFYSNIFETSYSSIFKNLTYVSNYEDGTNDFTAYKVITDVLKAYQYQYVVDLYGDVPYTEANLREKNLTPKYDDAETIYKSLISKLTDAAELAQNMPDIYQDPESQDIIFGGNMSNWASFANTIKLRMLLRLSNTGQDSYITDQISLINANGAGYITSSVTGNPGYSDDSSKQNPFWGYVGSQPNGGEITDRNDFTVGTDYVIDLLGLNNDPRLERLFAYSADNHDYKGAEQSSTLPGEGFTSDELSHVGEGLLINFDQDQPLMLLTEAEFLQAEAIARGYIGGGDAAAQAMYEKAIETSFDQLGVEDASIEAADYYAQPIANINWANSTNKVQAIITQKYYALIGSNGIESFIELTRTGFPSNLPIPSESKGVRPVRLLYPASEISKNSKNVPRQTQDDAFTSNPFWK